jgi:peptidoglycan biosynthesis protein MviN/MurJ (putative lipid II flippase)
VNSFKKYSGPAGAAILSASIGCFVIGLNVILSTISYNIRDLLNWYKPAGPLSGKTAVALIVWLVSWFILHTLWRKKEINLNVIYILSLVLVGVAFIFVFPPFYELFEHRK